jgi:hypothetical protein
MTEQAPDRLWSGIDISKTIAGALAAVCAAVIGSFLGVAGTLVGAAVASIIGSVGTEIWARSLRHGQKKLQETVAPAFIKAPAAVGTPEVAAAGDDELPSHTVPADAPKRQIRWKRVWLVAGVVFVLAMGSLTVFELISGKSVASAVGNSTGATSTVGGLLNPGNSSSDKTTTPTVTTTPTPDVSPTTDTATEAPATSSPTSPADTGSTDGNTEPTTAPTTEAPVQSPPAADSGQDQTP